MIKSIFVGSTTCVLLAVSVISYSRPFAQSQEPSKQGSQAHIQNASKPEDSTLVPSESASKPGDSLSVGTGSLNTGAVEGKGPSISGKAVVKTGIETVRAPETYVATAYSLRGRTASGQFVGRGLIAADPRVLPLGTRVRLEAGAMSGEYLVADTGGTVKGRHVDIWISSAREAMGFGRRVVKLTVLSYGSRRSRSAKTGPEIQGKRFN